MKDGRKLRLNRIEVRNFKAIDSLAIDFPLPTMARDPDVFVLGSKNGFGKTSILEACALLFVAALMEDKLFAHMSRRDIPLNVNDLLVRAGSKKAEIFAEFDLEGVSAELEIFINRGGDLQIKSKKSHFREFLHERRYRPRQHGQLLASLIGLNSEPLILPPLMYFHSYRKIQEGNPELGMMVDDDEQDYRRSRIYPRSLQPTSLFKLEILRSMMSQAGLFEELSEGDAKETLEKLNELVHEFAGGTIERLRSSSDNTVDFRVSPDSGGSSFTFDGLSSGQKEVISTLFLIWRHTRETPGIVLLDEPELHLNHEWHRELVKQMFKLAPKNQYLLATHSEDVFASVDSDRRILLQPAESPA
jgi:predicted ATP-binding protein involved in virulence